MAIGVLYLDWIVVSAKAFDDFKYQMDLLNGILLQNNQVRNKSEDKCHMILHECRLDPTVGKNLDAWFILRLKLIEDNDTEIKIKKSIDLINGKAFFEHLHPCGSYLHLVARLQRPLLHGCESRRQKTCRVRHAVLQPVRAGFHHHPCNGTLNTAVTSQEVMNGGCLEKLTHLQLNIQLLKN